MSQLLLPNGAGGVVAAMKTVSLCLRARVLVLDGEYEEKWCNAFVTVPNFGRQEFEGVRANYALAIGADVSNVQIVSWGVLDG